MRELQAVNFTNEDIDFLSDRQFQNHLELYKGYINKINEIWSKLSGDAEREEANAAYSYFRGLKKGETYALNGVILHELYFSNIGGTNNTPTGAALDMIIRDFGSYDNWEKDIIATGKAARGWAMLAYDQRSKRLHNFLLDAHDEGVIVNAYPVLILDVYEHAYFIDYGNDKEKYIKDFLRNINWTVVNMRAAVLK